MAQASAEKQRVASVPQRKQLASVPEPPLPKEKGTKVRSRIPDCEGGEGQGGQELHLGEREEDQSKSTRRKGWTPQ